MSVITLEAHKSALLGKTSHINREDPASSYLLGRPCYKNAVLKDRTLSYDSGSDEKLYASIVLCLLVAEGDSEVRMLPTCHIMSF